MGKSKSTYTLFVSLIVPPPVIYAVAVTFVVPPAENVCVPPLKVTAVPPAGDTVAVPLFDGVHPEYAQVTEDIPVGADAVPCIRYVFAGENCFVTVSVIVCMGAHCATHVVFDAGIVEGTAGLQPLNV
jgi:hypothetical protein